MKSESKESRQGTKAALGREQAENAHGHQLFNRAGWDSSAKVGVGVEGCRRPKPAPSPQVTWLHYGKYGAHVKDTIHPGYARQMWAHLDPCALTWCLVLGEPKESPRGRAKGKDPRMRRRRELVAGSEGGAGTGPWSSQLQRRQQGLDTTK